MRFDSSSPAWLPIATLCKANSVPSLRVLPKRGRNLFHTGSFGLNLGRKGRARLPSPEPPHARYFVESNDISWDHHARSPNNYVHTFRPRCGGQCVPVKCILRPDAAGSEPTGRALNAGPVGGPPAPTEPPHSRPRRWARQLPRS